MNASETLVCKKFCGSRKNASKIQVVAWVSGINKYLFKKKKKKKKRGLVEGKLAHLMSMLTEL